MKFKPHRISHVWSHGWFAFCFSQHLILPAPAQVQCSCSGVEGVAYLCEFECVCAPVPLESNLTRWMNTSAISFGSETYQRKGSLRWKKRPIQSCSLQTDLERWETGNNLNAANLLVGKGEGFKNQGPVPGWNKMMVTRCQKSKPILGKLDKNHKNAVVTAPFNTKQPFCFLEQSVQIESVATNELTMNSGVRV